MTQNETHWIRPIDHLAVIVGKYEIPKSFYTDVPD